MSLSGRLATNTIIQSVGKILSIALGWGVVLLLTNYLGAGGYGTYTIMTTYLQFFAVAIDLGLVLVSSQLFAEFTTDRQKVFSNVLAFRAVTALFALALAPLLVWLFPYSLLVKQGVVVLVLSFVCVAVLQVFTGLFQQTLTIWRATIAEVLSRLVLLLAVVAAIATGRGILFIALAVTVSSIVNVAVAAWLARPFVRLRFAYDSELWRLIWQRSWPIALGVVLNLVYLKADTLILSFVRDEAEVGVYGAMYRVLEVLITFPTMFVGLLLPVLTAAWLTEDKDRFRRITQNGFAAVCYFAFPIAVGVVMTAPRFTVYFGQEFVALGTPVLQLLGIATGIIFIGTYFGHLIVAIGQQRKVLWAYAVAAAVSLFGYVIAIPRFGALGAASMTVAVELLIAVLLFGYLVSVGIRFRLASILPAMLATAVMVAWLIYASSFVLWLVIPFAVLVYTLVLFVSSPLVRQLFFDARTTFQK
ncbi:MAG: oligosaccharide flippase family protein [Patescibacteria group bacterium]